MNWRCFVFTCSIFFGIATIMWSIGYPVFKISIRKENFWKNIEDYTMMIVLLAGCFLSFLCMYMPLPELMFFLVIELVTLIYNFILMNVGATEANVF